MLRNQTDDMMNMFFFLQLSTFYCSSRPNFKIIDTFNNKIIVVSGLSLKYFFLRIGRKKNIGKK